MEDLVEMLSKKLPPFVVDLIILITAILIGLILKFILTKLLQFNKVKNTNDFTLFRSILTHIGPSLNYFVPLLLINIMFPLMVMSSNWYLPLTRTVEIFLIISFTHLLISSTYVLQDFAYHKYDLNKTDNLKERKIRTQLQFIQKFFIVMIIIIAVSTILLSFENVRKIGAGLLTGVGIGGIIIGFAAQKSLANLLAGFQIAFTQPIRIDDVLIVEGEWGRVDEITLTYVVVKLWDQRNLILPINYFIEKPFQNWTRISSEILGIVYLYMDYSIPVEEVRKELTALLIKSPLWDKRVNVLQVTDAKEKTIEIRALMSALNSSEAFDLRCYIRENLITFIQNNYPDSLPKTRITMDKPTDNHIQN